jgi:hypothetical protein
MSGGRPSRPQTAEGDHPSCTNEERKDGETAGCARSQQTKGLVLTEDGAADPKKKKKKVSPSGLASITRKGWKPHGRDRRLGSRQPGPKGALLDKLKPYVDSLARIDDDGQELRYFENREGEKSLDDRALANIRVIRDSLNDLRKTLDDLKYRSFSLCEERVTGTHTTQLSRKDLYEIAKMLPPRSRWNSGDFDAAKEAVRERFGIGSNQFSKALDLMQERRELKAILGVETELVHLSDEKAIFLVEQWRIIHPPREPSELGAIVSGMDLERIFKNREAETQALKAILAKLTSDEIADAETIFYLARNGDYSESYEAALERKKREYQLSGDLSRELYDIMHKTNFLKELQKGVRKLGRIALAEKLKDMM